MARKAGLTFKQRAWLKSFLDSENRETFFNKLASAKAAGYKCKTDEAFGAIGYQNFKKLRIQIEKWADEEGLSDSKIRAKIAQGMEARKTLFFQQKRKIARDGGIYEGYVIVEREVEALDVQRKYVDMAARVKGLYESVPLKDVTISVKVSDE